MSIFTVDKEQDARLDAIEAHLRAMSEAVQQAQLDVMKVNISLIRMESALGEKLDTASVDPAIGALNEQLSVARHEYDRMATAASESWATLHAGATEAVEALRSSVEEAAARIEMEVQGQ